ncbi:MAG TPA: hypothetical protein VI451_09065 [Anaerolineales bacterium]|nr:hypothetical protein [Anaerolineales bacterium]
MKNRIAYALLGSLALILVLAVVFVNQGKKMPFLSGVEGVRGKAPSLPLSGTLTPQEVLAQDLALSEPRVQNLTVGRKSEVFGIKRVGMDFPSGSTSCAHQDCRQVEIYLWVENATVTAIVNLDTREVLDVLYQPGVRPGLSSRLTARAVQIIHEAPEVAELLGYQPAMEDIYPMQGDLLASSCDGDHICAAATFRVGDRFLWAMADLTEDQFAGTAWTSASANDGASVLFVPAGCPAPGTFSQDGWILAYETTPTDGLRVYNVFYNGVQMINSIKLLEWHVYYQSTTGFNDYAGCDNTSANVVYPYGETQINDLLDEGNNVIGFELVQDFRMESWGQNCQYRYEQHLEFFNDGRFRVVQVAYGKGCGTRAFYRPVVRIDIAIRDQANDNFDYWDGTQWVHLTTEDYRVPYLETNHGPHTTTPEGYAWKVYDADGTGYYIEMDVGQFGDGGQGDIPFVYATQHKASEGDTDMSLIGTCCNIDHQQGPHNYVNGESIDNQDLVIWYVSQGEKDGVPDDGDGYYCWTVSGEPNPETYPCFMGPMFHLISPIEPVELTEKLFLPFVQSSETP